MLLPKGERAKNLKMRPTLLQIEQWLILLLWPHLLFPAMHLTPLPHDPLTTAPLGICSILTLCKLFPLPGISFQPSLFFTQEISPDASCLGPWFLRPRWVSILWVPTGSTQKRWISMFLPLCVDQECLTHRGCLAYLCCQSIQYSASYKTVTQ